MSWTVGFVGGRRDSEQEFDEEEDAEKEYFRRLGEYNQAAKAQNKHPPQQARKPWIAPTGDDASYVMQGFVQKVIVKRGYFVVALSEYVEDEPLHYYWHDDQPFLKPGDGILFNHEIDPYPRKEGLFALRVYEWLHL